MPRAAPVPTNRLGQLVQAKRAARSAADVAPMMGVSEATLLRVERGQPFGLATAQALARWLGRGWTVDRVLKAAGQSPQLEEDPSA